MAPTLVSRNPVAVPKIVTLALEAFLAEARSGTRFAMTFWKLTGVAASALAFACGAAQEPRIETPRGDPIAPAGEAPKTSPKPSASARLTELPVTARPELTRFFDEEHVQGGIALYDSASGELSASDPVLAKRPYSPASTFKIAHTAIALELGVLDNPDSPMPWDGKYSEVSDWNRDHTLRTAIQVSCVPCFQRVARTIGPERMGDWLRRLDYGNHDISGGIDLFWLSGGLRITPVEELDFLRRLDTGKLPISERTLDIVKDVIALDVGESHTLYGKTGSGGPATGEVTFGWFVGFVALEKRSVYFATLVTGRAPGVDIFPVRRRVTESILRSLAVLPDK
jgi:beta-lactamase class D